MSPIAGRKSWFAGSLALLIIGAVVAIVLRRPSQPEPPALDGSTTTIVPGIHVLGEIGPAAAYVIETPEGLVLIDSGIDHDAQRVKSELAQLGLDWKKLRSIFLTHAHIDHSAGAEQLRAETGAKVCAGQGDADVLRAGTPRDAFFSIYKMPDHAVYPTTVDTELSGGEVLSFGDVRVRVIASPGHSPGSACYLVERGNVRALFGGDVIMRLGQQPLGTYTAYLAPRYRGDADSFLETLRNLRAIPVPDLVLPGHPRTSLTPQSPHLARQAWEDMLDAGIREMEQLTVRYETDGALFLDGEPKRLLPDLYYLGDFEGWAVYAFVVSSKLFVVDAPGGPGFDQFLKSRLMQLGLPAIEPTAILLTACGEKETAGLADLVASSQARVVAAPAGLSVVRKLCPPDASVISAEDLPRQDWFRVSPISLRGRGVAPAAYLLYLGGKTILFSGKIPDTADERSLGELAAELAQRPNDARAWMNSLQRLSRLRPDLWLPAVPSNGQNAALYDRAWQDIVERNYRAAAQVFSRN